ncbi:hypothetical protein KY335_05520 [Candidatus Woesearchaeota archaeon]|nr:hypothetical protein [Candidatus Woesearchaeota archaeon]
MDIGGDSSKFISDMKKEFADFKETQKKQMQKLSRENSQLKTKIKELEKQIPTKDSITSSVLKKLESKISSIQNQMLKVKQFDQLLSKNEKFNYLQEHFSNLDKISMTKKQYAHFSKEVDRLRKETAELISLKKQLEKLSKIENELMKLSRKVPQLEKKLQPVK